MDILGDNLTNEDVAPPKIRSARVKKVTLCQMRDVDFLSRMDKKIVSGVDIVNIKHVLGQFASTCEHCYILFELADGTKITIYPALKPGMAASHAEGGGLDYNTDGEVEWDLCVEVRQK